MRHGSCHCGFHMQERVDLYLLSPQSCESRLLSLHLLSSHFVLPGLSDLSAYIRKQDVCRGCTSIYEILSPVIGCLQEWTRCSPLRVQAPHLVVSLCQDIKQDFSTNKLLAGLVVCCHERAGAINNVAEICVCEKRTNQHQLQVTGHLLVLQCVTCSASR